MSDLRPLEPISPTELARALDGNTAPRLLDVREPAEFVSELGHVAGSELVPLATFAEGVQRFNAEAREIVIVCRSGMRAGQAAELLARAGKQSRVLKGGMLAWNEAQLPISRDPA